MKKMINIFQPSLGKKEIEEIKEVFESNWTGKGQKTKILEKYLSNKIRVDRGNVTTVTSCTEGLFQIIELLSLDEKDEVVLPSISFVGAGNAIVSSGAKPVFCDVDCRTLNVTAEHIEEKITEKTKAVILIHYAGLPCEMDDIVDLCESRDIVLIEDNACSPFSKYRGNNTGTIGNFGTWSFDSMKILVIGDGGLIYCDSKNTMKYLKEKLYLGLMSESGLTNSIDKKWWEFNISSAGRRSIINDITASIGLSQIKKVDSFIKRREYIHKFYTNNLKSLDWLMTPEDFPDYIKSSYYMYWIQTKNSTDRDDLARFLREQGIYSTFRYYPLHRVPFYNNKQKLENTETAANSTLCIPLHQSLSNEDIEKVVESIKKYKR
tara:strand:+ start:344 stop:1477 length:1134 start_codon:yes stop_codon:yes gene_type:complete